MAPSDTPVESTPPPPPSPEYAVAPPTAPEIPVVIAPLNVRKSSGNSATPKKSKSKSQSSKRLPLTPPPEPKSPSSGITDRRKSSSTVRSSSGDSLPRGRNGSGPGPKLPVVVSETPKMSLADMRTDMRVDDDTTPGESSDAFEDAAETVRDASKSRANSFTVGDEDKGIGLGINGHSSSATSGQGSSLENKDDANEDFKPKMSARLSRWVSDEPVMFSGEASPTTEKAPPLSTSTEGAIEEGEMTPPAVDDNTPDLPNHSRQVTAETAPSLVPHAGSNCGNHDTNPGQDTREEASTILEQTASPSQEQAISLSNIRAGLQSHSRQGTAEVVPILPTPISEPERERSVSPTKMDRVASPDLNGDAPLQTPPSSMGRIHALEQRNIGERKNSGSPQPGGLMRTASTRMGQFLGRMGSMRKPGRSPPGRQDRGFPIERRNTSHSLASIASNGGESLATISDGPEGDGLRPSLQDQFQSLRKRSEFPAHDTDGHEVDSDDDLTLTRIGSGGSVQDANGQARPSSHRESPVPSIVRSPPTNPSLPPGTASGMSAGPAEQPRTVDWDLWQAVVYEGPSAVQRSSGEELSQAIASGIPAAIRGVVWQVLADSKNPELESVYKTLKARGSSAESDNLATDSTRPQPPSRKASEATIHEQPEKEEKDSQVSSSRASVHSDGSTAPTSNMASPPMSVKGDDQELRLKLLAEKQKREAAALTKLEKAIRRDLGSRTSYSKFTQAAGLQDGLFGVCKAYALFDEGVGYAQGINFIAMPLLFNMTEEEAFTLLVRLMSKYDLRSLFTGDMAGLHLRLYQFERLLEDNDPALYCHLRRRNVAPQLYATQWFLTLFAYRFPLQLVLRVYDLLFSEGLTAILKFGLVLMQHNRDALLAMKDMGHLTNFLKEKVFDVYIDKSPSASSLLDSGFFGSVTGGADKELYRADEMLRDVCDVQITEEALAGYAAEWEETQRATHEKEAELENLRTSNASLTAKVKGLEERTQQQDTEHVNMAGDVVRFKVENDTLLDENEGLKMKVEELQQIVDTQPAEVEAKLKEEMDRILQRNSEVQSENRVLKEEMEEMEQELVNVKMLHAQTQSDFDAMMQKFSNIQSLLSEK